MSPLPTPRHIAAQWFQRVWNERDASAIPEFLAPGCVGHMENGHDLVGPEAFHEQVYQKMMTVFPDLHVAVQDIVAEGDRAYVRWVITGTHRGEGLGMVPTDKVHTFGGITWFVVRDGKIVEGGDSWNQGALLAQMAAG